MWRPRAAGHRRRRRRSRRVPQRAVPRPPRPARRAHHGRAQRARSTAGWPPCTGVSPDGQRLVADIADQFDRVRSIADGEREYLQGVIEFYQTTLTIKAALVGQAQNEEVQRLTEASYAQNEEIKKISAWAAIFFAPTLVGTVYGMNFDHMPELHWTLGYPFALLLMAPSCALHRVFKRPIGCNPSPPLRRTRPGGRSTNGQVTAALFTSLFTSVEPPRWSTGTGTAPRSRTRLVRHAGALTLRLPLGHHRRCQSAPPRPPARWLAVYSLSLAKRAHTPFCGLPGVATVAADQAKRRFLFQLLTGHGPQLAEACSGAVAGQSRPLDAGRKPVSDVVGGWAAAAAPSAVVLTAEALTAGVSGQPAARLHDAPAVGG